MTQPRLVKFDGFAPHSGYRVFLNDDLIGYVWKKPRAGWWFHLLGCTSFYSLFTYPSRKQAVNELLEQHSMLSAPATLDEPLIADDYHNDGMYS